MIIDDNRHLLILTYINNIHFHLVYYKNEGELDKNIKLNIKSNLVERDIRNKQKDKYNDEISSDQPLTDIINDLNNLKTLELKDIINLYDNGSNKEMGIGDIYLYLYYLKLNNNAKGKYSQKFFLYIKTRI